MINANYRQIIKNELKKEALTRKKPLSWFVCASRTNKGEYIFLPNKDEQWHALEVLAYNLKKMLPELSLGQIFDILAEQVNAV